MAHKVSFLLSAQKRKMLPTLATYTSVMSACSKQFQWQLAASLMAELRGRALRPDALARNAELWALAKGLQWRTALHRLRTAPKNTSAFAALMDCFAKGSRWQDAFQLAFHMEEQGLKGNLITFNLLLNACERSSQWLRGLQLYQQMRRRDLRDVVSVNSSLGALVSATQWRRALQLWEEAETEPTEVTMNTLLMAYSSALQWQMALQCWQGFGLASSEATFGVLMDAMGAPGVDWRFSLELLNESGRRSRNVVTYTSAMKVLSRAQQWEKALKLFEEMQDMEVPPNALTVDVAMAAARSTQNWQKALQLLNSLASPSGLGCGALREMREVMEENAKRKEVEATQKALSKDLGRLLSDPFAGEEQPLCAVSQFLEDLSLSQPLLHRRVLLPLTTARGELKVDTLSPGIARYMLNIYFLKMQSATSLLVEKH